MLGSPPHHRRRNSITSCPAGLWDVCRKRERLWHKEGAVGLLIPTKQLCQERAVNWTHPERMLYCLNPTHSLWGSGSP